ncbi:hypothetical protein [Falsiroseomonas sp. CW058]|uniref:hypothetical protein n=1 Tax=Falsiroseomonas sp. CW058 TaxID=3388664 RepID=UPI003D323B74
MLEKPGGDDLLATARDVVLNELLPTLPPERALAARMVAAAIAIALRERAVDAAAVEAPDLAALSGEIRAGLHDPGAPTHGAVRDLLRAHARLRASVSAPKALG